MCLIYLARDHPKALYKVCTEVCASNRLPEDQRVQDKFHGKILATNEKLNTDHKKVPVFTYQCNRYNMGLS